MPQAVEPAAQRPVSETGLRDGAQRELELVDKRRSRTPGHNVSAQAQISRIQDASDAYTRKVELEKRRVDELDRQMEAVRKRIWEQRESMGGINASRENTAAITKQIAILENRLDTSLKKYNEAIARNKRLRESIDSLRRERLVFDQIYAKLEREMAEKNREMARTIEASNKAYEARDAAQHEKSGLKAQAEREQAEFESEWEELGRMVEQDRRMKAFMAQERAKVTSHGLRGERRAVAEEAQQLKRKVLKGSWGSAQESAAAHTSVEKMQAYEEAFAQIQATTSILDVDELVTTFVSAEDPNFALFNFVNELNGECEKLEGQISEMRSEIEKYKGQRLSTDSQRKKILKDLERRLACSEAKSEQYERKHEAATNTVSALKLGIHSVFGKVGCSSAVNLELLGSEGVTEANLMQYLGIIEQRTHEILQLYAASQPQVQARDAGADAGSGAGGAGPSGMAHLLGQGPRLPAGSYSISIRPPSTGEDDGSDSDEDYAEEGEARPLSRDELTAKTIHGLHKREAKENKFKEQRRNKRLVRNKARQL